MKKNKLSPKTIKKLEWLKSRLRRYPHRYDQANWCGTQGCLAGYCLPKALQVNGTVVLGDGQLSDILDDRRDKGKVTDISDIAANWLGITDEMADRLFAASWFGTAERFNRDARWPRHEGDTDEQAAEKACQRIDLFIKSGGEI